MFAEVSRRDALLAAVAIAFAPRRALARGRSPVGGSLSLHLPWPTGAIDPHRIDDATCAILGGALFDSLYAPADGGAIVPALAESDPEPVRAGLRVPLRAGIRTAQDRPLDARDAIHSLARARSLGARGWLAGIPAPRMEGRGALVFPTHDAEKLLRALSCPLVAILPANFSAD